MVTQSRKTDPQHVLCWGNRDHALGLFGQDPTANARHRSIRVCSLSIPLEEGDSRLI